MSYATAEELYNVFGRNNVRKWADVNNGNVAADIDARLTWALDTASADMNDKLRKSPAQFPLTDEPFPASVVLHCCYMAGVLLYNSRGVTDMTPQGETINQLSWARKEYDRFIRGIYGRTIVLDIETPIEITEAPFVEEFDEDS